MGVVTIGFYRIRIILDKTAGYEYHAYKREISNVVTKILLTLRIKHLDYQMEGALWYFIMKHSQ